MVNDVAFTWNGSYWYNGSDILINDKNSKIDEITTTNVNWAYKGAVLVVAKAGNGLYYTSVLGSYNYATASNVCAGKGMRIASVGETIRSTSIGVPCSSGWCWTSTPYSTGHLDYPSDPYYGFVYDTLSTSTSCVK